MAETSTEKRTIRTWQLWLPTLLRYGAVAIGIGAIVIIGISFLSQKEPEFRMKGFPANLSDKVTAVVEGYERKEIEGDVVKFYIKADKATTFDDQHQEFENVFLQVFAPDGTFDSITAEKSIYVPKENKDFTVYFAGNIEMTSRDGLKANTEQLTYKRGIDTVEAEEKIAFIRDNIEGSAASAVVRLSERNIDLVGDVVLSMADQSPNGKITISKVTSDAAGYDQANELIKLNGSVAGSFINRNGSDLETSAIKAGLVNIQLTPLENSKREVRTIELFQKVSMDLVRNGKPEANVRAEYAKHDVVQDGFYLRTSALVERFSGDAKTQIAGDRVDYLRTAGKAIAEGNASVKNGISSVRGTTITAEFSPDRKLRSAKAVGSAELTDVSDERTATVRGAELIANFGETGVISTAKASGAPVAVLVPTASTSYSKATISALRAINLTMKVSGGVEGVNTDGRTTLRLDVSNSSPTASAKTVVADSIKTTFHPDGKFIARAEAIGNAELLVEPLNAARENYKSITYAPRFDCEFFQTGNSVKVCSAFTKTRTLRTPTVAAEGRGEQTITSDRLRAIFGDAGNGLETLTAEGNSKFVELDRNAIAGNFIYSESDGIIRLRGNDPTVWDSRARGRATEIDWFTREQRTYLRGKVSTTYYSRKSVNDSAPFSSSERPVFITSDSADIDHRTETAVYRGNARGWQDENYVRGDQITILQREGRLLAEGSVQSMLYQAKRASADPIHAASARMEYRRDDNFIRYENNVDIRRGSDRLTGNSANFFLDENNEVSRSEIDGNVVVTQPGRRATGAFARYVAADETVYLRGDPATLDDTAKGSSRGSEFTMYLKGDRVVATGRSNANPTGRIRSVHKLRGN